MNETQPAMQSSSVQLEWQKESPPEEDGYILEVKDLVQYFPIRSGWTQKVIGNVKAVDGVSFVMREKEVLGVVGESGCGKTTMGRSILRLYEPTSGEIWFRTANGQRLNVAAVDPKTMKELRREMRMIFQDPFSSLNPRLTVKDLIGEPLVIHHVAKGRELEDRVADLMRSVGLDPAYMGRYPHEFSGGQRQRIGLARTLALNPRLIVADEPVSALDVSIQAQVLNLLEEIKQQLGLTLIFIAHDLSVVEHICDRIAVMYLGKIAELAESEELLRHPYHPYTEALLSAIPPADPDIKLKRIILEGDVPSPIFPPSGCVFHPRCRYAQPICGTDKPVLREVAPNHFASCHFAGELTLQGVDA
jgi:oligopeptide/dipeptide ABC transporter ATP-binding protein